jgi:hypothetical protein
VAQPQNTIPFLVGIVIRTIFDMISTALFSFFPVPFLSVGADEKSEDVPAC